MAGPALLPPFSFWAASISCLLISASSMAFFLASASRAFFSASAFLMRSSSSLFFLASSFSCSALISFLLLCFSLSLFSSSSSLLRSSLQELMYSLRDEGGLLLSLSLLDEILLLPLLPGQLLLLFSSDLLPLALFLLEPLQLLLLLAALISPGVDVFLELLVEFIFVHASLPLGERLISLSRGGGGVGHTIVIHPDTVFYVASSLYTDPGQKEK